MEAAPEGETEEEKAIRLLYCSLCKVAVNSASQLQAHNSGEGPQAKPRRRSGFSSLCLRHSADVALSVRSGTKHKTMLEARSGDGAIKSFPRTGVKAKLAPPSEVSTGLQYKTFHCEICDVHVNSETQLKQVSRLKMTWSAVRLRTQSVLYITAHYSRFKGFFFAKCSVTLSDSFFFLLFLSFVIFFYFCGA